MSTALRRLPDEVAVELERVAPGKAREAVAADGAGHWRVWGHALEVDASIPRRGTDTSTVVLKAKPAGPWSWLSYGTSSHTIRRKRVPPGSAHPRALAIGGGGDWAEGPVVHPGIRDKRETWDRYVRTMVDLATDKALEVLLKDL